MKSLFYRTVKWAMAICFVAPAILCSGQNYISGKEIILDAHTLWVVEEGQPEAVQRALDDVKMDWYKVFGHAPLVLTEVPGDWKGTVVYLGLKGNWRGTFKADKFDGPEHFILRTQQDVFGQTVLVATGADVRGSIYAAYTLSEEILGVDPWYYWADKEPERRKQVVVPARYDKKAQTPTFKYRGWFINDEDLLNKFAPDPLKENVFSLQMFDKIYETLLRLKGNMIVPATFPFPDERCQELAARRGLVLNMHHILVLGLNTYRWPKGIPFSHNKNPEIMEKYWQTCIEAFKDYETVWTVGYRGKHDRAFWADEPDLKTPEARGKVITDAIARQVEMIRKIHPDAPIISNLWDEGAEMYHQGYLKLPEGITIVWPDNGAGIIRDQDNVLAWPGGKIDTGLGKQHVKAGDGIYYHTAMLSGHANQLSEMVNPLRIYKEIGRFVRAKATEFFLVNVSDIRPVPMTTECVMRMVWDARPHIGKTDQENVDRFLQDWVRRQFGNNQVNKITQLYKTYFDIPYQRDGSFAGENTIHTRMHRLHLKAMPLISQRASLFSVENEARELLRFSSNNIVYLNKLAAQLPPVVKLVPADRKNFFNAHLVTQVNVHLHSNIMLNAYAQAVLDIASGNAVSALANARKAMKASDDVYSVLQDSEHGKWAGFYMGENLISLYRTNDEIRVLIAHLKGEPTPPVRPVSGYREIEKYHEPFLDNFPLLYPPKSG